MRGPKVRGDYWPLVRRKKSSFTEAQFVRCELVEKGAFGSLLDIEIRGNALPVSKAPF